MIVSSVKQPQWSDEGTVDDDGGSPAGIGDPASDRVRVRRKPTRGRYDRSTIDAILDAAVVGTVSFVANGQPFAVPMAIWRVGDRLYIHGSAASRAMTSVSHGEPVCVTAILLDGYVLATAGFNHSFNYRSVMVLGRATLVTSDAEKTEALRAFVEHLHPGRWAQLRQVTPSELKATKILWVSLDEASAKVRAEGAHRSAGDDSWPVWAGVVPLRTIFDAPIPEPDLPSGLETPHQYVADPHSSSREDLP